MTNDETVALAHAAPAPSDGAGELQARIARFVEEWGDALKPLTKTDPRDQYLQGEINAAQTLASLIRGSAFKPTLADEIAEADVPAGMVPSFWSGLDHIANFINALDTSDMTAKQVRTAIYSECLTARPKQATPTDEAVLREREACAQIACDQAAWERDQSAKPDAGKKAATNHLSAAHACEMVEAAIRARSAPSSIPESDGA